MEFINTAPLDVRGFIRHSYTPYTGDDSFLVPPTERTLKLWEEVKALLEKERSSPGGVLEADGERISTITAYGPGYIDRDLEVIVGLQTDRPLKRAIMPNGGVRMVEQALKEHGCELSEKVKEIYKYRRCHNESVFDVYTPDIRAARTQHLLTGLPDAYGRGRIIGDYRRVALYGVDRLLEEKDKELRRLDRADMTEDIVRRREETAQQKEALRELIELGESYGFDLRRPAKNTKEAVQWLYMGYLAAVKQQNGAAMSLGRVSTFLDVYAERDLKSGACTEAEIQEIVDQFVMKLRMVRFLRTKEYDAVFAGDPVWVTESIGGMCEDGRPLVTKMSFRFLHTLTNLGPLRGHGIHRGAGGAAGAAIPGVLQGRRRDTLRGRAPFAARVRRRAHGAPALRGVPHGAGHLCRGPSGPMPPCPGAGGYAPAGLQGLLP